MQMPGLAAISLRRDSTDRVAREWAVALAELFSVSLTERGPRFVDLWVSALVDLEPHILDAACRRSMQTCKFYPMPAELRRLAEQIDAEEFFTDPERSMERIARRFGLRAPQIAVSGETEPRGKEREISR